MSYSLEVYLQVLVVNMALNQTWIALLIFVLCAFPGIAFRLSPVISSVAGFASGFFIPRESMPPWWVKNYNMNVKYKLCACIMNCSACYLVIVINSTEDCMFCSINSTWHSPHPIPLIWHRISTTVNFYKASVRTERGLEWKLFGLSNKAWKVITKP